MMAATTRGWPLPEQTTNPPDVVHWLTQGLGAADTDVTKVNQRILYGPVASLPATLLPGQMYLGW
jgi:hypothetical protein